MNSNENQENNENHIISRENHESHGNLKNSKR